MIFFVKLLVNYYSYFFIINSFNHRFYLFRRSIYLSMCMCGCVCIYIYRERECERQRDRDRQMCVHVCV